MKIREASLSFRVVREGTDPSLDCPEMIARYVEGAFDDDPTVEWFIVVPLNSKHVPHGRFVVTKGIAKASLVHPREVLRPVILAGATAFAVAHNHPSGDPAPSQADHAFTRRLREAGQLLDIPLLDHVIVGDDGKFFSFADSGLL